MIWRLSIAGRAGHDEPVNSQATKKRRTSAVNTHYLNPHAPGCPWHAAAELVGAPNIKWCETTVCSWISEPANTWSNALYLVFAVVIYMQCRKSSHLELRWMGPAMFFMGLFSLVYHASNNYVTQVFDFIGMYLLVFWFLVINLRRCGFIARASQVKVWLLLSVACTGLVHAMYLTGLKFQLIVAVGVLAIIATEVIARRKDAAERVPIGNFVVGLCFVGVAQVASLMDGSRTLCMPDHAWLQGHAIWHVLAAIGLYFAYLHYRQMDFDRLPPR